MTINQISIFLENKPGQLAGICRALAKENVNIATLSLAGFAVIQTEVVMATVPDRPGGMAEIMEKLDAAGVDIEYSYAYALGNGGRAILVFKFSDNAKALAAIGADDDGK